MTLNHHPSTPHEALARRLASSLDSSPLSFEITERLRVSRARAMAAQRIRLNHQIQSDGSLLMSTGTSDERGFWWRLAALLPLVALVVGLLTIHGLLENHLELEVADIETALLTDDLPLDAYTDPGFLRFLTVPAPTPLLTLPQVESETDTSSASEDTVQTVTE